MTKKILRIAIIGGVMPSYGEGFYNRLFSRTNLLVKVYCQESIPDMNLKTIHHKFPDNVQLLKYISAKRERISWQFIPWKEVMSNYDVIFVNGNPRNLSHALFATFLRIIRKKVVLYTMAHSFRSNQLTENIRLIWSRIFDFLLVYTDYEVEFLRKKGFKNNYILGQNNGLDQNKIDIAISLWPVARLKEWRKNNNLLEHTLLLSCARLESKNEFHQIVQALPQMINRIPNILWCIIGSGTEQPLLESMVKTAGISNNVRFVGELYNEEEIAPWFLSSEIFLHPAAIGLSLLHAFGYGLPVVTNDNRGHHNPEFAAFEEGRTGHCFRKDDIQHLSVTVIQLLNNHKERLTIKDYVQKVVHENYNVDIMVERFVQIARRAASS